MENVGKTRALMMVAHPDDCVIFGYPFFANHKQFDWTICYLTYKKWETRAQEMIKFWSSRSVSTIFLGYLDDHLQIEKGVTGFDNESAKKNILKVIDNYDLIVTHNSDGEYGHLHHIFVHDVVKQSDKPQLYFAGTENSNYQCVCQEQDYLLDELPIHKSVIEGFMDRHIGRYQVPNKTKEFI